MMKYPPDPQLVQQALNNYQSESAQLQPLLLFYQEIYEIQRNRIEPISPVLVKNNANTNAQNDGQPLLKDCSMIMSGEVIRDTVAEIVDKAYRQLCKNGMLSSSLNQKITEITKLVITDTNVA